VLMRPNQDADNDKDDEEDNEDDRDGHVPLHVGERVCGEGTSIGTPSPNWYMRR
jgi:hypothetical protein